MYDPRTSKRFNILDPRLDQGSDRYAYVSGDPVNMVDPSGESGRGRGVMTRGGSVGQSQRELYQFYQDIRKKNN